MSWNNVIPAWVLIVETCGCCGQERATRMMTETPVGWICKWCGPDDNGNCVNEDCQNHKDNENGK